MTDHSNTHDDRIASLTELFIETGRAHHAATGGINPQWAEWYADYLDGRIDEHLDASPGEATLTEWLTRADQEHRSDAPHEFWPSYYAQLFLGYAGAD